MPSTAVVAEPTSYVTQTALAMGDIGQSPVAISAANPLPVTIVSGGSGSGSGSGSATAALQTAGNASLATIAGNAPALVAGRLPVDGSGVTQPVSGTVALAAGLAMSISNLPAVQPVSGTVSANIAAAGPLALEAGNLASIKANTATTAPGTAATAALPVQGVTGGVPVPVSLTAAAPGQATSALQATGNGSLAILATNSPALVAGRIPVDGSAVTQPVSGSVSVANFPATQPISGSVAVTNLPSTQPVSGTVSTTPDGVSDGATTAAWTGTGVTTTGYGTALVEVSALGGATTITVSGSLSSGAFKSALPVYNMATDSSSPAITAPGLYQVTAAGQLSYAKDAGTPAVALMLKR